MNAVCNGFDKIAQAAIIAVIRIMGMRRGKRMHALPVLNRMHACMLRHHELDGEH